MVTSWQLWLSGPRPDRLNVASNPTTQAPGGATLYEFMVEPDGRHVVQETHYIDKEVVRSGNSGPPLHIHLEQTETFKVVQGVLGVVVNGKEVALTPEDAPVSVPSGARHRFWPHKSNTEDLVFKVWVKPEGVEHGFDESFMRNFSTYLSDCERANSSPSPFQMILFLYKAGMVLTPPFYIPIPILKGLHHIAAIWIGEWLLGYQSSYPEYSHAKEPLLAKKGL